MSCDYRHRKNTSCFEFREISSGRASNLDLCNNCWVSMRLTRAAGTVMNYGHVGLAQYGISCLSFIIVAMHQETKSHGEELREALVKECHTWYYVAIVLYSIVHEHD